MTPRAIALLFFGVSLADLVHFTALKSSRFKSAGVGESVTLNCSSLSVETLIAYWFKQTLGQTPELVSTFYIHSNNGTLQGQFSNHLRFSLDTGRHKNHLRISNLKVSDSGTYHCVVSDLYNIQFSETVTFDVRGSGLTVRASVSQSAPGDVRPGGSATLGCAVHAAGCDGERGVYWFRSSGPGRPGLLYADGYGSGRCGGEPDARGHACVYNLPLKSLNQSQAGTYHCAVAACGLVLFGNGTTVDFKGEPKALVAYLSGALAFAIVLILSLAFTARGLSKCLQRADSRATLPATSTDNAALSDDGETLHYAAVKTSKTGSSRERRDDARSHCVYSVVKPEV